MAHDDGLSQNCKLIQQRFLNKICVSSGTQLQLLVKYTWNRSTRKESLGLCLRTRGRNAAIVKVCRAKIQDILDPLDLWKPTRLFENIYCVALKDIFDYKILVSVTVHRLVHSLFSSNFHREQCFRQLFVPTALIAQIWSRLQRFSRWFFQKKSSITKITAVKQIVHSNLIRRW